MDNLVVGDAFHADEQKSQKRNGISLQTDRTDINSLNGEIEFLCIDPKCTTVCKMKTESDKKDSTRSIIAGNNNYICYIVKKTFLRVIDSSTEQKVLLRGHQSPIVDVNFSKVNKNVVCSVDEGLELNCHHIFLWELSSVTNADVNSDIKHQLLFALPLRANNVKCHPLSSIFWIISTGNQLGTFNTNIDNGAQTYENLKSFLLFKDKVIDFDISPDGKYVAVLTGRETYSTIGIFKLTNGNDVEQINAGNYTLVPFSSIATIDPKYVYSAVSFIPSQDSCDCVLVTLSLNTTTDVNSSSTVQSNIHVWNINAEGKKRTVSQVISLTIPKSIKTEVKSSSSEFPASSLCLDTIDSRFLTISNRNSHIVTCLGVSDGSTSTSSSSGGSGSGGVQRLYHCTLLNLNLDVSSVGAMTAFGCEKDRRDEAHVLITCFQESGGQSLVNQYHVPFNWVFQPPKPSLVTMAATSSQGLSTTPVPESSVESVVTPPVSKTKETSSSSGLLKGILFSKPENSSSKQNAPSLITKSDEPILSSLATDTTAPTSITTTTATTTAIVESSEKKVTGGISILYSSSDKVGEQLTDKKLLSTLPVGSFPDFALIGGGGGNTEGGGVSTSQQPVSVQLISPATSKSSNLPSEQVDIGMKSKLILSDALKTQKETLPVPSSGSVVTADDKKLRKIPVTFTKPSVASSSTSTYSSSSTSTAVVLPPKIEINKSEEVKTSSQQQDDEDDWEKASSSLSQPSTPLVSSGRKSKDNQSQLQPHPQSQLQPHPQSQLQLHSNDSSDKIVTRQLESKLDEILNVSLCLDKKIVSLEEKTVASDKLRKKEKAIDNAGNLKALADMKVEIIENVVKNVERVQTDVIFALVDDQVQSAVTKSLANEKWKQELSVQILADLRRDITPIVTQAIRNTVKENLRDTLATSFRSNFESSIIPAYEAATKEMFSQMQNAFSVGLEQMKLDTARRNEDYFKETVALRSEISSLKDIVSSLESKVIQLSNASSLVSPVNKVVLDIHETDFKQLHREGRIGESLEVALELKDVSCVLWVLKQHSQTPNGLSALFEKSSDLCILCAIQQLSADLTSNEPEEGVRARLECLKEMIIHFDDHIPKGDVSQVVMSALESLKSAELKVGAFRKDIKFLIFYLSSKFEIS